MKKRITLLTLCFSIAFPLAVLAQTANERSLNILDQAMADAEAEHNAKADLVFFEALAVDGEVLLEWATESQTNSEEFLLFRSYDRLSWSEVDAFDASGTAVGREIYETSDLPPAGGEVIYKLVLVGFNGVHAAEWQRTVDVSIATASAQAAAE